MDRPMGGIVLMGHQRAHLLSPLKQGTKKDFSFDIGDIKKIISPYERTRVVQYVPSQGSIKRTSTARRKMPLTLRKFRLAGEIEEIL